MQVIVFIFYLLLFSFVITIIPFFKNGGIERLKLVALFNIKIAAGIAYAKFYQLPKYNANSDTWRFYRLSLPETKWLVNDPAAFLLDLFHYGYTKPGNIFSGQNSYWNDLKSNLLIKLIAVFNLLSNSNYYVNIIFFNFLFLFGLIGLFKVFYASFPTKKWLIVLGVFLLPSTLFWCSGIHKDGLILSAIGVSIYSFDKLLKKGFSIRYFLLILVCFVVIFSFRNYILFALLPAMLCWWIAERNSSNKNRVFISFYAVAVICFFIVPVIFPAINFPLFITNKQQEFLHLASGSEVTTAPLQPTFVGFIYFLPHAIDMAFLQPHVTEFHHLHFVLSILENLLFILLIVFCILSVKRHSTFSPLVMFSLAFSISVLLICGYTIPITGAIVRYKSVVLPLLITPLLCLADFAILQKKLK